MELGQLSRLDIVRKGPGSVGLIPERFVLCPQEILVALRRRDVEGGGGVLGVGHGGMDVRHALPEVASMQRIFEGSWLQDLACMLLLLIAHGPSCGVLACCVF